MAEYIERERLLRKFNIDDMMNVNGTLISLHEAREMISNFPAADVEKMSDGYHTFADLYEQRLILSAALAKNNPHAWKSKRHEDGSDPFGGGWFIMGFDTDTEKRSRFLGHVRRVETEAEARAFLDEMRKKYYDARHNCWCFVLHDGTVRYGDDGEPQGTAGQPMLNVFQRENVENVVCIVTRYFGGILLGAGGLTRAYAKAAKDALDAAGKARMQPFSVLLLECPYPMFERIKLLIEGHEGRIESSDYGAAVTLTFLLPVQKVADFSAALTELSGGQMSAEEVEQRFLPGARE